MRRYRRPVVALLFVTFCSAAAHTIQPAGCEPNGRVRFICGLSDPEDLVAIPRSEWVAVSALTGGGLYVANTQTAVATKVFPASSARADHDRAQYPTCPSPLDATGTDKVATHGLAVRAGAHQLHTLYAVFHGARESIEVFTVDAGAAPPTFIWTGCLVAPPGVVFNGVAILPDGGLLATHFIRAGLPIQDTDDPTGEVWEWHPRSGWAVVPGSASVGPNGVEASPDGEWIYVNLWLARKVMRLSRNRTPVVTEVVDMPFRPDNMHRLDDGRLLVAGHHGDATVQHISDCFRRVRCTDITSNVARLDPATMRVEHLIRVPYDEHFWGSTAALLVGREIWIGAAAGTRIARYPLP
jgi:sugar lactone lactonase YvrE